MICSIRHLYYRMNLNLYAMKTVLLEAQCGDEKKIREIQTKLNQWTTIGLMVKFTTHSSATHWMWQVLLKKEKEE